jgi:serine/threonine protein kinase
VKCGFCGALVVREQSMVERERFRKAWLRAREGADFSHARVECAGHRYDLLRRLGHGEVSEVFLGLRKGSLPLLATVKLSSDAGAGEHFANEWNALAALRRLPADRFGLFFISALPEPIAIGLHEGRQIMVLGHAGGYWGSLADLTARYPEGIDPRHAVWIWRRMLGALRAIHAAGWAHGSVRPEHALVHPRDHGVRLIGWERAGNSRDAKAQAEDLSASARIVLVLLNGGNSSGTLPSHVPRAMADLILGAAGDTAFCLQHDARVMDELLCKAAREAFGPPSFVPLET